jgi:death-on-curing protein
VTRYLSVEDVLYAQSKAIEKWGGRSGLRDPNALASAVGRLQTGYYQDIVEEAAALFESLSQNHPFLDGNKRTAIACTVVFLTINGYQVLFDDLEAYSFLSSLYETGQITKAAMEAWLRTKTR